MSFALLMTVCAAVGIAAVYFCFVRKKQESS
jgi:hypothetical protein